jgi:amino acid transporter
MSAPPKPLALIRNIILGSMLCIGSAMIFIALPVGLFMTWEDYHVRHLGWHQAIVVGVEAMSALAALGGLSICIVAYISRRCRKKHEMMMSR